MEALSLDGVALEPQLEPIKEQALLRSINSLRAIGCKFAIIDPYGNKHGDLEVVPQKKNNHYFARGELRSLIERHVGLLSVGEVGVIPTPDLAKMDCIRAGLHQHFVKNFGAGTYVTRKIEGALEVMRTA